MPLSSAQKSQGWRDRILVNLVRACGGWKYRKGIPLSDEQVERGGEVGFVELVYEGMRLALAEKILDDLGRGEYYRQQCEVEKIPPRISWTEIGDRAAGITGEPGRSGEVRKSVAG
jgi:hypothetical protein